MQTKRVGGFSLIEVLVAVLVLAIGALGAARAQVAALQTRHNTALMSSAVQLAGSLADRMRANASEVQGGDAFNPYLLLAYDALADGAPVPPERLCFGGAECNGAQMAAFDMYEMTEALHAGFPGARVVVCRDAAVVAEGRGVLAWDCAGGAGAPIVIKLGWRTKGDKPEDEASFAPAVAVVARGAS